MSMLVRAPLRRIVARQSGHMSAGPMSIRALSQSSTSTLAQKFEEYKPQVANAGLWAGGGVMLFGLTKGVYTVFTGFLSLTPYDMGWYGFLGGFCTAGLMGIGAQVALRRSKIFPEVVYQSTLRALQNSDVTHQKLSGDLAGSIQSQGLKAYKIDGGTLAVVDKRIQWQNPRIQMIFDVRGEFYDGLATVEAVKERGALKTTFIGLDVMNAAEDRVLVQGDPERLQVKDELRGLISFKSDRLKK